MSLSDDEDDSSSEDDVDSLDAKSDYTDDDEDRDFFDFGSSGPRGDNRAFYGAWLEEEDSVLPVVSPSMTPCRERSEWISRSSLASSTLSSSITDPAKVGAPTTRARSGTTGRNRSGSNRSRRNEWFPLKSFIDLRSTSDSFDAASSLSVSGLSLGSLPLNPFALDGESVLEAGVGQVVTPPPESPGSAGEGGWRWRSFIDVASL